MTVKIIILRTITPEEEPQVRPLLKLLHSLALDHEGYVSGESLTSWDDPNECLVISTWKSKEDWEAFIREPKVLEAHNAVDAILAKNTMYQVYYHG